MSILIDVHCWCLDLISAVIGGLGLVYISWNTHVKEYPAVSPKNDVAESGEPYYLVSCVLYKM